MTLSRYKATWLSMAVLLLPLGVAAQATWTPPTPEELAMKSEPKAPAAAVIVLSYNENDDAEILLHVRLKVLTSGGLSAGTIRLPDSVARSPQFADEFFARTIHADGTVILFAGTPQNSNFANGNTDAEPVISMPSVEVGSILEYICHIRSHSLDFPSLSGRIPVWLLQGSYFIRSSHYVLNVPSQMEPSSIRWVATLPRGIALQRTKNRVSLDLTDVPGIPEEEFAPPLSSTVYNVRFFYYDGTREQFWGTIGDQVDRVWSNYYLPRKALVAAVQNLTHPGDTDEQKLHSLYTAVMKMENTDFTRAYSKKEDKKNGLRSIENSEDTWLAQRGNSSQLTLLFIALARSAGYSAYPMAVASRNRAVFNQDVLSWSQMDSIVAIVTVNGRDFFFDPGTRRCPFAMMAPWHTNTAGVSVEGKLIKIRYTPAGSYANSKMERVVDINLSADGSVGGTVKIVWAGTSGLAIRQAALLVDSEETRAQLEKSIQAQAPNGVILKLTTLDGIDDTDQPLTASFTVTGNLGSSTQKRLILPSQFFEASAKAKLSASVRTLPVEFPAANSLRDIFKLHLPADLSVEALPSAASYALNTNDSTYRNSAQAASVPSTHGEPPSTVVVLQRVFVLNKIDYAVGDYAQAHTFFGQVASSDREPVILRAKPADPKAQ